MKLRERCKCGAVFEASGLAGNVAAMHDGWREAHQMTCYGIRSAKKNHDDGRWMIDPRPVPDSLAAEARAAGEDRSSERPADTPARDAGDAESHGKQRS